MKKFALTLSLAGVVAIACNDDHQAPSGVIRSRISEEQGGNGNGGGDGHGGGRGGFQPPPSINFHPLDPRVATTNGRIDGFQHKAVNSRFAIGQVTATEQLPAMTRLVGTEGVFLEGTTGYAKGIPNGDAPASQLPAFSTVLEVHHQHVIEYFKGAGIPADQMGEPQVVTMMKQSGTVDEALKGNYPRPTFVAYSTVIPRQINGVSVPDSHAWARFNNNNEVMAEEVWWPELPSSLYNEITTLQNYVADVSNLKKMRAQHPGIPESDTGALAIHHPLPAGESWYAKLTVDFIADGSVTVSFDQNGTVDLNPTPTPSGQK